MNQFVLKLMVAVFLGSTLLFTSTIGVGAEVKVHRKSRQHDVELYVTSWCPYCKKAQNFLNSKGVDFKLYDIEKDAGAAKRKNQLDPGRGVPFAVINGVKVSGWSKRAYEEALK